MNSNDNSKLQLVKDESKRLQEEIRELLNKNSHLQNDIDDLCKQKEDALTRYMYNDFLYLDFRYKLHCRFFLFNVLHLFTQYMVYEIII